MKNVILTAGIIMITAVSFGQKKEIKKAAKAIKSADYVEAMAQLSAAEALMDGANNDMKADFFALKALALTKSANNNLDKMKMAAEAYAQSIEAAGMVSNELAEGITELRTSLINSAVEDQNADKHASAADKLYTSYSITKNDTSDLYFAASSAVNGQDYPTALKYYKMLLDMGYKGNVTSYVATNIETGEVEKFGTKNERDLMVKAKQFIKPETKMEESKQAEILRNMTLIYIDLDQTDEAKALLTKARAENPDDTSLMRAEANMAYKLNDLAEYNRLMELVVASDPDNPELYFNLGVGASGMGEEEKALNYYERALALRPDYREALINFAILKLSAEKTIVEEMNGLGNSRADNARYDELKDMRNVMYEEAVPFLEKAIAVDADEDSTELMKTLMSIYSQIGETEKYNALKAKVDGM
jgi:tetratricopeptide (TPR) repeat protein